MRKSLDSMDKADEESHASIDHSAVKDALKKRKQNPEPEARFMLMRGSKLPADNFQNAVDSQHVLTVEACYSPAAASGNKRISARRTRRCGAKPSAKNNDMLYAAAPSDCSSCEQKSHRTQASRRSMTRHM